MNHAEEVVTTHELVELLPTLGVGSTGTGR